MYTFMVSDGVCVYDSVCVCVCDGVFVCLFACVFVCICFYLRKQKIKTIQKADDMILIFMDIAYILQDRYNI